MVVFAIGHHADEPRMKGVVYFAWRLGNLLQSLLVLFVIFLDEVDLAQGHSIDHINIFIFICSMKR